MKRNVTMAEISDGRLYVSKDMVKAGCMGCGSCCRGMGKSIVLDPMDINNLYINLEVGFEELMKDKIELNVVDGIVLPNIKMSGVEEKCGFLDGNSRCSVHDFRPGICRLFPLGRYYEDGYFKYFLQTGQCKNYAPSKVKVKQWLDMPELKKWEDYINQWHFFLKDTEVMMEKRQDENFQRKMSLYILQKFYIKAYGPDDFYNIFSNRLEEAYLELGLSRQNGVSFKRLV